MTPRFIAVEGPIGVGKTTLARRLAEATGARLVADPDADNPWLAAFYDDPASVALHVQLHFLLARLERLESIGPRLPDGVSLVSDFLLEKDRLFAELTLEPRERSVYERLHERLVGDVHAADETRSDESGEGATEPHDGGATRGWPEPDLVIYLQAPTERLIERIERRGQTYERRIDSGYLDALSAAYERFFHGWTRSPLLIVNTDGIDLARSAAETRRLLERVEALGGGRHYFNPGLPAS